MTDERAMVDVWVSIDDRTVVLAARTRLGRVRMGVPEQRLPRGQAADYIAHLVGHGLEVRSLESDGGPVVRRPRERHLRVVGAEPAPRIARTFRDASPPIQQKLFP